MPFYLSDMTEFLYRLVKADDLKHHFYYMGGDNGISANELCLQIDSCLALSTHREQNTGDETLWIDSRLPYNLADEFLHLFLRCKGLYPDALQTYSET